MSAEVSELRIHSLPPATKFIAMNSRTFKSMSLRWMPIFCFICGIYLASGKCFAVAPDISAAPLRAKYTELSSRLLSNQFKRELYLDSAESSNDLKGEIYAVVDYPFATVNVALNNPAHWCDVLILPNVGD